MDQASWTTGYFYCSDKSNGRNTASSILRGIISQLVGQNREPLVPYCLEKKSHSASPSLSAFSLARGLIETICEMLSRIYIVIDGMDECQNPGDRKLIVDTLTNLVDKCNRYCQGKLRVLFLGRSFYEVDRMSSLPLCIDNFSLTPENSELDIEKYCKTRFRRERGLLKFGLSDKEKATAIEVICFRANGNCET